MIVRKKSIHCMDHTRSWSRVIVSEIGDGRICRTTKHFCQKISIILRKCFFHSFGDLRESRFLSRYLTIYSVVSSEIRYKIGKVIVIDNLSTA